jgi:hypothetical protein
MKTTLLILLLTLANIATAGQAITCIYLASVAAQVMELRQAGVEQGEVINNFSDYPRKFKIYKADALLLRIIDDAYELPVQEVERDKLPTKWKFGNAWFELCLSKEFKIKKP